MCGEHERFWWPLDLSERERAAVDDVAVLLQTYPRLHDRALAKRASALLAEAMRSRIGEIEDRDTMPNLCHVINGWGNAPLSGGSVLDGYARYVHRNSEGTPSILQCSDEGDFHPWQSFAYAVMAGVSPDTPIAGAGCSLFELAVGSRALNTTDGCELGHLLYTAAHFGLPNNTPFAMGESVVDLDRLVELAIDAHHEGHFRVCRKVHLTEGLCAIAAFDPAYAKYRETAQGFLEGQLDLLPVLCAAVHGARDARDRGGSITDGSVVNALRDSLVIEGFIENHYYLAGHLIELATLAHSFGYQVSAQQWAAARFLVDELNRLLPEYLPQIFFPASFLHFGHYRRAITLLEELADGQSLDRASRARFTADFRHLPPPRLAAPQSPGDAVFRFGRADAPMRAELADVIRAYRTIADAELGPRGNGAHFRRVLVRGWPRWLHFELCDYGAQVIEDSHQSGIGVELHLEDPQEAWLFGSIERVAAQLRSSSALGRFELDRTWWAGSGRLRVWFEDGTAPEVIALALRELIEIAMPILGSELQSRFPVADSHAS